MSREIRQISGRYLLQAGGQIVLATTLIGLASSFRYPLEFQYWWGPKFSEDLTQIPCGVTRHESKDFERSFHGISRTEFWWYIQDGKNTFECEELKDIPCLGLDKNSYGCRFIHSMIDPSGQEEHHLDGAIRLYNEEAMISRLDININQSERDTQYTKLWRIDGPIKISEWKEIITHYFRDNYLIGEYFKGEDDETNKPYVLTKIAGDLSNYVPSNIEKEQGIKLSISYHKKSEGCENRSILVLDSATFDNENFLYIEYHTLDLVKVLKRMGEDVFIPENIVFIAFEDLAINFPVVMHRGHNAHQLAMKTMEAMTRICKCMYLTGDDRCISFTIGIEFEDRDVLFSFAGHVIDLVNWFEVAPQLPLNINELGDWSEIVSARLIKIFKPNLDNPPLKNLIKFSGILQFERKFLDPQYYKVGLNENEARYRIFIPEENKCLELLQSGKLTATEAFIIYESKCSKCKSSYFKCNCSKWLDGDIRQDIEDMKFVGLFWTNRSAWN